MMPANTYDYSDYDDEDNADESTTTQTKRRKEKWAMRPKYIKRRPPVRRGLKDRRVRQVQW